ncbi:hypothetical protein [Candidatus Electronema sp. PJ]|uniref:hypothetical protein n=1 Tax=Candidatus Electronema sp. PJ TaxID=3401572 RepID=UPI003AA801CA
MSISRYFAAIVVLSICMATGCSQEPLPFAAVYTSRDTVAVTYQGKQYLLNRYSSSAQTPFRYRFEDDGDLDIFINGKEYDVDSPYDIDSKKATKSLKKKTPERRKTTASTSSRTTNKRR